MKRYLVFALSSLVLFATHARENIAQSDTLKAWSLFEKANSFKGTQNYDSARFYYEEAAKEYEEFELWERLLVTKRAVGSTYYRQRRYQQCVSYIEEVLTSYSTQLDQRSKILAFLHYDLATYYYRLGAYPETIENYSYAINDWGEVPFEDRSLLGDALLARGYANMRLGRYNKALLDGLKAEQLFLSTKNDYKLINAYNLLGITYRRMGEYEYAVEHYRKFLRHMPEDIAYYPYKESMIYFNIGVAYSKAKNYESAIGNFEDGLTAIYDEPDGFSNEKTNIYSSLGEVYASLGQNELAIQYYDSGLVRWIDRFGPKSYWVINGLVPKAIGLNQIGKYQEAIPLFEQALAILKFNKIKDASLFAKVFLGLGRAHGKTGNHQEALVSLQLALNKLDPNIDSLNHYDNPVETEHYTYKTLAVQTLEEKARAFKELYHQNSDIKDLMSSSQTIDVALQVIEQLQLSLRSEEAKIYFNDRIKRFYELAISCALELYNQTDDKKYLNFIYKMFESNKSVVLREELEQSKLRSAVGVPDSILLKETELKSLIAVYQKRIYDAQGTETDELNEIEEKLFQARRKMEELRQNLKANHPSYFTRNYFKEVELSELQESLQPDELIIEYFWGKNVLYMLGVTKTAVSIQKTTKIQALEKKLSTLRDGIVSRDFETYTKAAFGVYAEIILPILKDTEAPREIKKITIIPDGLLSYVPYEVLISEPPKDAIYKSLNYLVRDFTINYNYYTKQIDLPKSNSYTHIFTGFAPTVASDTESISSVASTRDADSEERDSLQPLIHSKEEVQTIANLLDGIIKVGRDATEDIFKQHLKDSRIVHLASHATVDNLDPMYSKLLLFQTDAQTEDGALYNYELYNMDIKAGLVCLSACNTGYGQIKHGEGVMSLARGFSYAGCPSLITSLWAVSDQSSSKLMSFFYLNLDLGMSKDEALRQAKLDYLEEVDENGAPPYFWGGFIHVGDTAQIDLEEDSYLYLLIGLVIAMVGVGWMYRKNTASVSKDSVVSSK